MFWGDGVPIPALCREKVPAGRRVRVMPHVASGEAGAGRHVTHVTLLGSAGATHTGAGKHTLRRLSEPHMLCGLRAHMLDIHTSMCVCVYIYTDIYERDYYRRRFTYIINTRNYCRIFKMAESAPDIRKCISLSLPSQLVPLVRLVNATCQSPS